MYFPFLQPTQKTQKSYIINETESVIYNCAISRFLLENISFNFGAVALIIFEPRRKVLFQALSRPPPLPYHAYITAWFVPARPIGNIESHPGLKISPAPSKGRPLMPRDLCSPIYYTINSRERVSSRIRHEMLLFKLILSIVLTGIDLSLLQIFTEIPAQKCENLLTRLFSVQMYS